MARVGTLFHNKKGLELNLAVRIARREFEQSVHTRGFVPSCVLFHPQDLPGDLEIDGLAVLSDRQVPRNHIRITTHDMPLHDEFKVTMVAVRKDIDELLEAG